MPHRSRLVSWHFPGNLLRVRASYFLVWIVHNQSQSKKPMLNKLANKLARVLIRGNHTGPAARVSNKCNRSNRPKVARLTGVVCAGLAAAGVLLLANTALAQSFNKPGNILIADQFNNRVIEVSPAGNVVWSFGHGPNDFSARSIIGVNDAQRVGWLTLMAGTGTPAGVIPEAPSGAPDNRVILVDPFGKIVWQYGQFGLSGSGPNLLNTPVQCTWLPNFDVLITDQANNRIIEVNLRKQIVWQYPGSNTNAADQLNNPNSANFSKTATS